MKRILNILFLAAVAATALAQDADIKILAVNDLHSHIENFPKLAFLVDSIRAKHPDALLVSAGDNRTGNPVNDNYDEPNLPAIEMMNLMGFNMSTMGNHECDAGQASFANTINKSNFPFVVANVHPHDTLRIRTIPFKLFEHKGVRIGVIGLLALATNGLPACLPKNVEGIRFTNYEEEMARYAAFLRSQSNVFIALSHLGMGDDTLLADRHPELDLIIGGHSHDLVKGINRNGVTICQAQNYAKYLNEIDITVREGKVTGIACNPILVKNASGTDARVQALYDHYRNNPSLRRVVAQAATPFDEKEELGIMMANGLKAATGADIAVQNQGGVRMPSLPAGDITVQDILQLDPFGNLLYTFQLTGQQIADFLADFPQRDTSPVWTAGITYIYKEGVKEGKKGKGGKGAGGKPTVVIKNEDGSKFDLNKTYTFACSQFVASISPMLGLDKGTDQGMTTSEAVIKYLQGLKTVDFKGRRSLER